MADTLTTSELLREVSRLTADLPVEDGRVAKEFTERNVRYYVTLGVVRPPVREANRSVWTREHVFDLVRVRRAQALGMSLKLIGPPAERVHAPSMNGTWRAANSPALRAAPAPGRGSGDTGWTVRLAPDLMLSGFGPMLDDEEFAAVRAALPSRFMDARFRTATDTPTREDGHQ